MDYVAEMTKLQAKHEFFIGFDSDGCIFDTMEIKQKECFCPNFIKHFDLQPASKFAREVWEFVNLYSKSRGCNRFQAVLRAFDLMRQRPEFAARGVELPELAALAKWVKEESKLGNPALEAKVKAESCSELAKVLAWSKDVNTAIAGMVYGIPPFPGVKEILDFCADKADMLVVSQTPLEALKREWEENKIDHYLEIICGQEHGTKTEHLKYCAVGKYAPEKILMVGDAPGDQKAAEANKILFYPIVPGREEESWAKLREEGLTRFFGGTYAGSYQAALLKEFDLALPEKPTWNK
jgi:phosphoglycolate phosphatase-like HAD superfamily hydrolase